ncbi:MAG: hypothetical protein AVDCRST_MAG89-5213, partial [uncultured Gemmatimonadetes bacterium]
WLPCRWIPSIERSSRCPTPCPQTARSRIFPSPPPWRRSALGAVP